MAKGPSKASVVSLVGAAAVASAVAGVALATSSNGNDGNLGERIDEWGRIHRDHMDAFQPLAVEAFEHAFKHNNPTMLLRLQNQLHKAVRKLAFASHIAKYSPVRLYNEDKATGNYQDCKVLKPGEKTYREWDVEAFKANPFFDEREETKPIDLTAMDQVKRIKQECNTLIGIITGTSKKPRDLKQGQTIEDAKVKLKKTAGMITVLASGSMCEPWSSDEKKKINEALAFKPAPAEKAA